MPNTRLQNVRLLLPDGRFEPAGVSFGGVIRDADDAIGEVLNGHGALLTPGLIDLHTHGVGLHAFERSVEDLVAGLRLLPRFGVTTVLPTLYRVLTPRSFSLIDELAGALDVKGGAHAPGFHLEGPFLAIVGAGALTLDPDVGLLDELVSACRHRVKAMSISPELPGIVPVVERLRECGITPFITHTCASAEQSQAAIDAGARHATHFYDVFPVPAETEPGVRPVGAVEAILADTRATVDFIPDGVHVHPVAIRAALAAKGARGIVAITDSNVGAGLPVGRYETPWGYRVAIQQGDAARIADVGHPQVGTLAGSALTMNQAVANLVRFLKVESAAWLAATGNPAAVLGMEDRGVIKAGARGDLVLWNDNYTPRRVWIGGQCVYAND